MVLRASQTFVPNNSLASLSSRLPSTAMRRHVSVWRRATSFGPSGWGSSGKRHHKSGWGSGVSIWSFAFETIGATRSTRFARLLIDGHDGRKIPLGTARRSDPDVRPGSNSARGRHAPDRGRGLGQWPGSRQHGRGSQASPHPAAAAPRRLLL